MVVGIMLIPLLQDNIVIECADEARRVSYWLGQWPYGQSGQQGGAFASSESSVCRRVLRSATLFPFVIDGISVLISLMVENLSV